MDTAPSRGYTGRMPFTDPPRRPPSASPRPGSLAAQQFDWHLASQRYLHAAVSHDTASAALVALAEMLCPLAWDLAQRAGQNPATWPPEAIGRLIAEHAPPDLRAAYRRQTEELTSLETEVRRLRQDFHHMQALATRQREALERLQRGAQRAAPEAATEPAPPKPKRPAELRALARVPEARVDSLLWVMATTGLSRSDRLRARLGDMENVSPSSSRVGLVVRAALERGLVEARPCRVDWPGPKTRTFLLLTPLGRARVVQRGRAPVPDEYTAGLRAHKTPEHLYLVLYTADLLRAGDDEVDWLPECRTVGDGEYCPDLHVYDGRRSLYVECERSYNKVRPAKWQRAGRANGGTIYLVAPNRRIMQAVLHEIALTTGSTFRVWAFNLSEHARGRRGPGGSVWAYQAPGRARAGR